MPEILCPWEGAKYIFFSDNTPSLLFYSHIPAILVAGVFAILVLKQKQKKISEWLLSFVLLLSILWTGIDLVLWATNRPDVVMFFWTLQILIEIGIYTLSFNLSYSYINEKPLSFKYKIITGVLILPVVLLLPTKYNLLGVNLSDCTAVEGLMAGYYTYFLELVAIIAILITAFFGWKIKPQFNTKHVLPFISGILLFLMAFSWGNITGSFSDNWILAQFGLIGMPIFVAFLGYIIVKFKAFNVKLLASEALIFSIWLFVFSLFFIGNTSNFRLIIALTSILLIFLGYFLIKSVKREIKQREQLEILTKQLEDANEKLKALDIARSEFITIASHQLRTPPATIKWYLSGLLSGDYGKFKAEQREILEKTNRTNNSLISLIDDMLNVSRIERGKMEFLFEEVDLLPLADLTFEQLTPIAKEKNIKLTFKKPVRALPKIMADKEKIRQVMNNLIDNALKYTKIGNVAVNLWQEKDEVKFSVTDTGKGITPEENEAIFQKFSRGKESIKQSAGLGLGLYVAKVVIEQHKGKIWAESPGSGKGSVFTFSLPVHSGLNPTSLIDFTKN